MLSKVFNLLKVGAVSFYLVALASLLIEPLLAYQVILLTIVALLLVAHVGEYLAVRRKLEQLPTTTTNHFFNVLLFGFLYWLPLLYPQKKRR